jgi:TldD protein
MDVDVHALEAALSAAVAAGDFADAFYERRIARSYRLQDGKIHEAGLNVTMGVGIRAIAGDQAGYAHTDDLSPEAILDAAKVAALIARDGGRTRSIALPSSPRSAGTALYAPSADQRSEDRFVALLGRADAAARAADPRIGSVNAFVLEETQEVLIANSDGLFVRDVRPLVALGVQCIAQGTVRGNGYTADGGRTSLSYFDLHSPESIAIESARIACVNAEAIDAPAGDLTVVVGGGSGGVLLHEAVGHGLEGDFNRQGTSLYSGRIGERVASELVTIYDDGNLPEERGSVAVDDEGTPGAHKVLVENGVLRAYMHDRLNASLMGSVSTGSGRRQSFRSMPQPRMCNTYMPAGDSTFEEIIGSVKRGIFAKSFSGGQVEISKGDFVFMLAEGYLIEDGKLTAPIRNATLIGNGPEIMTRVVAVGNDSRLASRHYSCGKGGQYVPVGVGMPTVKISSVTVGGSSLG